MIVTVRGNVLFCLLNLTVIFGKKYQILADLLSTLFHMGPWGEIKNHSNNL